MVSRSPLARVKAIFVESSVHFAIAAGTSLQQLSTLLSDFGKGHGELLVIEVSLPALAPTNATAEARRWILADRD
jgi:hypothetical protein